MVTATTTVTHAVDFDKCREIYATTYYVLHPRARGGRGGRVHLQEMKIKIIKIIALIIIQEIKETNRNNDPIN